MTGLAQLSSALTQLPAVPACAQVTRLNSPVGSMEYKAFVGLPHNDAVCDMLPPDARGPDAGMVFFALTNLQPDKPSPGSISLYCLKDWAGTMSLPEGMCMVRGPWDRKPLVIILGQRSSSLKPARALQHTVDLCFLYAY